MVWKILKRPMPSWVQGFTKVKRMQADAVQAQQAGSPFWQLLMLFWILVLLKVKSMQNPMVKTDWKKYIKFKLSKRGLEAGHFYWIDAGAD